MGGTHHQGSESAKIKDEVDGKTKPAGGALGGAEAAFWMLPLA